VSATIYAPSSLPRGTLAPTTRDEILAVVMDPSRLPSAPAVALQIVNAASQPDCPPTEIVSLLGLDPVLCGKLLKAVNSCLYGLKQPVASVARAVHVVGLRTVRSLALGLSLPAVKVGRGAPREMRDFWVASVGGAIIARELAVLARRPSPDDELVAGLLRDLGEVLLRQAFAGTWEDHVARHGDRTVTDPCRSEKESFGIDHADAGAELIGKWGLPPELVEPIRHHHHPERLAAAGREARERAELLWLASNLVHLDAVAQYPPLLARVLGAAEAQFGLPRPALIEFLQRVVPKIESFASVLNQDIGQCPDFAAVLAAGAAELVNLTVENSRNRMSGTASAATAGRAASVAGTLPLPAAPARSPASTLALGSDPAVPERPEFCPEFLARFPATGCRLGEYQMLQQLGRGAMGVVFKAFEPSLHRHVAIKMLAQELAATDLARQRFAREGRAAAAIQHDNVVAIHAVREARGIPFLAMEYVNGGCLETRVQQHGPMPIPLLVSTARQITAGLGAAHARNIVHRDVKPSNILIENESGRAKLTDFGLARVGDDAALTTDGTLIGTPFFMAPEVVEGATATALSDLFSLGGVFYLMATGRVPFAGQTVAAVFNAVTAGTPPPPRRLRPNVPGWLEDLILRLLRKEPAERFADAAQVAAVLASHG
jgi:HD-like signal output (HDOD) protein/tRNA A-37 threonylcarbamoyl transferase component Bud32